MKLIVDFPQHRFPSKAGPARVSFANASELNVVENLSVEHKADLWFTKGEMDWFKVETAITLKDITSTMSMAEYAERNAHETSAFMGLECHLSPDGPGEIRRRRGAVWEAVAMEQRRQQRVGARDPEAISNVSMTMSDLSRKRARIVGLLHAFEA